MGCKSSGLSRPWDLNLFSTPWRGKTWQKGGDTGVPSVSVVFKYGVGI